MLSLIEDLTGSKSLKMPRVQLRNRLSPEEMNRGVGMLDAGVSQRHVARLLNVSQSVVSRMWNRYQTHGDPSHRHEGGRSRATTQRQDRYLLIQARRQRFRNATLLNNDFRNATGVRISTQTVRQRLHEFGLNARRPAIRVPLTQRHVQDRLDFSRIHVRWTIRDWTPVLFTDESRFCLDFTDKRQLVWRMRNEKFDELNVAEHDRYGKGSVLVWAGISVNGKTELYVIENGTLTAVRYCNEILDQFVRPYAGAVGPEFILMDDNARPHRANVTNAYLERETIERMEWPAKSPDLNPIEHAWDILQRAVSARPVQPTTLQELKNALVAEWRLIPQNRIQNLITSMRRRCRAVINARGRHTRY